MSLPWCRLCKRDVLPGVGCACRENHAAAEADRRRELEAEREYWEQMDASLAAEQAQRDADAQADDEYEARRARAAEDAQAREDFRRGTR